MTREDTKVIQIGTVKIGGGNPVAIQSMTNTKTEDVEALLEAEEKSEGKYTADMLETALSEITATYDYSVQNNQLTLTEREYGDQLVFDKK